MVSEMIRAVLANVPEANEEYIPYGRTIAKEMGWPEGIVLAVLREARDQGLVQFGPVFNTDEGYPCGGAYALTKQGSAFLADQPK